MAKSLSVSAIVPADREAVYAAWLDGRRHSAMTGAAATGRARVGARFTAWDGYAWGKNLALDRGRRIVQSWRSSDFAEGDPDSKLTVILDDARGGTRVTIAHSEIPDGQTGYRQGWINYYLKPMKAYFAKTPA